MLAAYLLPDIGHCESLAVVMNYLDVLSGLFHSLLAMVNCPAVEELAQCRLRKRQMCLNKPYKDITEITALKHSVENCMINYHEPNTQTKNLHNYSV